MLREHYIVVVQVLVTATNKKNCCSRYGFFSRAIKQIIKETLAQKLTIYFSAKYARADPLR